MNNQVKNPKAKWYIELMERFDRISKDFNITGDAAHALKTLLLDVAREQYMTGNRSGIAWIKDQMAAKSQG